MTIDLTAASPRTRAVLEQIATRPSMDQLGIEASRAAAAQRTTNPPFEDVFGVVEDAVVSGSGDFRARAYLPSANESEQRPLILYAHAGGWILGDLDHSDHLCRRMCNRTGAVVVNVGYRLAPEHRFPTALNDCDAALTWALGRADLRIDPRRIALAGESSGGNLAAALAIRLGKQDGPSIAYLLLLEPALDARMDTESWRSMGDDLAPPRRQMRWMWDNYLANVGDLDDAEANPSVAINFPHHPETTIVTAGFDPLRDEGLRYAERLKAAGVKVHYRCEDALMHAFCNLGGIIPEGLDAFDRAISEMMASSSMSIAD